MDVLVFARTPIFFDQRSLQRRPPMSPTRPIEVPVPGRGLIHSILTGAFAAQRMSLNGCPRLGLATLLLARWGLFCYVA